jgi:hypothetical protein
MKYLKPLLHFKLRQALHPQNQKDLVRHPEFLLRQDKLMRRVPDYRQAVRQGSDGGIKKTPAGKQREFVS